MIYLHTYILYTNMYYHEFFNNNDNRYYLVKESKYVDDDTSYHAGVMVSEHIIRFDIIINNKKFDYMLPNQLNIIEYIQENRLIQLEHSKFCISLNSI